MCPGWRHLPGRCCGVLIILIYLQLLRLVVSIPTPEGLPSYPADRIRQENSTPHNLRTRGSFSKLPQLSDPESKSLSLEGPDSLVYKHNRQVKQSPQSYFSLLRQSATKSDTPIPDYFYPNLPSKAPFPFPLFDHNFLLNLGIPLLSETSLDSGETQRNTRSAWNITTHTFRHHRVNFQLYSLKAWTLLQLLPNGTVGLSANESDPHTFLKIQPLQMQQPYTIRLRSVATGIYLCMNRQGNLYSSCNRSSECEFLPRIEKTYYTTIESKQYPKRYLAIGSDKRIKRARRLRPGKTLIEDHFFLAYKKNLKATDLLLRKVFPAEHGPVQHCADFTPLFAKDREVIRSFPSSITTTTTTTIATPSLSSHGNEAIATNNYSENSVSYSTKLKSERNQNTKVKHSRKKQSKKCETSNRRKCRRRKCKSEKCREKRRKRRRRRKEKMKLLTDNKTEEKDTSEDSTNQFPSNNSRKNNKNIDRNNGNIKNRSINNDSVINLKNISIISSYKNNFQPLTVSSQRSSQDSWRKGAGLVVSTPATPPAHRTRHKHGQLPHLRTKGKPYFYTEAPTHTLNVNSGSTSTAFLETYPVRNRLANKVLQSHVWPTLAPSTAKPFLAPSPMRPHQWSDSFVSRSYIKDVQEEPPKPEFPIRRNILTQPPFRSTPSSASTAQPNTTTHTLRNMRRRNRIFRQRPRGRNNVIKR